uniref:Uncharacterized protein n=1 Tax=Timema monikensis TaxID=170555 RepID=A0A7R9E5K7_9NEOP|nr:unnamed protein product [Timema monikensis]
MGSKTRRCALMKKRNKAFFAHMMTSEYGPLFESRGVSRRGTGFEASVTYRDVMPSSLRRTLYVAWMGGSRTLFKVLTGKPSGKIPLGRPRRGWEENIRIKDWIELAQDRDRFHFVARVSWHCESNSALSTWQSRLPPHPFYVRMRTTVKHHVTGTVKCTVPYKDFCLKELGSVPTVACRNSGTHLGKTTLSILVLDSNLNFLVIDSLAYCKSSVCLCAAETSVSAAQQKSSALFKDKSASLSICSVNLGSFDSHHNTIFDHKWRPMIHVISRYLDVLACTLRSSYQGAKLVSLGLE